MDFNTKPHGTSTITLVTVVILAVIGVGVLLTLTRAGSVLSPDSAIYIGAADNLLAGRGLSVPFGDAIDEPLTHHAPFYPILLAFSGVAAGGPLHGAQLLAALLFGANMALIGLMAYTVCRSHSWLAIVTVTLGLTSVPMLLIHVHAWSEPLFLLLGFGGLLLLAMYLQGSGSGLLILSAASIGLAFLTRYAGITLATAGLFGILVVGRLSPTHRLRSAAIFGVICFAPIMLWLARNSIRAGTATNRELIFHPAGIAQARQVLSTLSGWLLVPENAPDLHRAAALGVWIGLLIWIVRRIRHDRRLQAMGATPSESWIIHPLVWLLIAFVAIYGLFLVASISLLDANTPLDDRILSPILMATLVLGAFLVDELLRTARNTSLVRVLVGVTIAGFVVVSVGKAAVWSSEIHTESLGLMKEAWRNSETIRAVQALTETTTIYSNAADLIYLHTGKSAMTVPRKLDLATQNPNDQIQAQLQSMAEKMKSEGAILVYFGELNRSTLPTENELKAELPLQPLVQTADGAVFGISSNLADTDAESAEE